jgi:hypothetical protein
MRVVVANFSSVQQGNASHADAFEALMAAAEAGVYTSAADNDDGTSAMVNKAAVESLDIDSDKDAEEGN